MRKNIILKTVMYVLIVTFALNICPSAFAHSSSQAGILTTTYDTRLERDCVGSEKIGWIIDEDCHTTAQL